MKTYKLAIKGASIPENRSVPEIEFEEWSEDDIENRTAIMKKDAKALLDILVKILPAGTYDNLLGLIKKYEKEKREEFSFDEPDEDNLKGDFETEVMIMGAGPAFDNPRALKLIKSVAVSAVHSFCGNRQEAEETTSVSIIVLPHTLYARINSWVQKEIKKVEEE